MAWTVPHPLQFSGFGGTLTLFLTLATPLGAMPIKGHAYRHRSHLTALHSVLVCSWMSGGSGRLLSVQNSSRFVRALLSGHWGRLRYTSSLTTFRNEWGINGARGNRYCCNNSSRAWASYSSTRTERHWRWTRFGQLARARRMTQSSSALAASTQTNTRIH